MNARDALLVIDMQRCNLEQSKPVFRPNHLLQEVSTLVARAHGARVPIVYIQHCGAPGAIDQPETPGWEIHPSIAPIESDIVLQKRHPDAFQDTNLQTELRVRGMRRLIVAGIQTEYCIDTTCRRAYSLDYDVILVKDAHSTWDTGFLAASQIIAHHNQSLGGWFVTLKEAREIEFDIAA